MKGNLINWDVGMLAAAETPTVFYFWWLIGTRDYIPPAGETVLFISGLAISSVLTMSLLWKGKTWHQVVAGCGGIPLVLIWCVLAWDFLK